MTVWKLTIEYEGTRYAGWQEQSNARTVAGEVRRAAESFFNRRVELTGSGRTDAGVHALGQVASLTAGSACETRELRNALNDRLPADINIVKVEPARRNFDPRRDALARYYLYQIATRRTAFAKKYVWWVKDRLDIDRMSEAAVLLVGKHDFAAFAEKRGVEKSTIVNVERAGITTNGDLILFRIGASHFLWKMVRRITGLLVEVGRRRLSISDLRDLLKSKSSFPVAAHTAPPSGLFLERVIYEEAERSELRFSGSAVIKL